MNWVQVDGDVVATDPTSNRIHVFRGSAAAVWQLIDGAPIDGLVGLIAEEFGLVEDEVRVDLAEAVDLLDAAGVLECRDHRSIGSADRDRE